MFENAFLAGATTFSEAGEVSVSADGATFSTFPCAPNPEDKSAAHGCAGYAPVLAGDEVDVDAANPETAGGDAFDLADLGLAEASFVRVVDKGTNGAAPSAGFDLDAMASVHASE